MTNKERIDSESGWFFENLDSIISGHYREQAVIRDHRVWGYFSTPKAAVDFMDAKGIKLGDYAMQDCVPLDDDLNLQL
jgi:hypothetical protein